MVELRKKFSGFFNSRWLVFVAATWTQACGGIGYLFGSISPVIKSSMNYNQKQIATLGVAKDIGDCMGFLAGSLSEVWPLWGVLLLGALQVFIGYGWIWLVVTHQAPPLPLWALCALIFIGTNCDTYFNTAALVSCVQNFPKNRGPIVGILKGFNGLSGAILTQIYVLINSPDHASLIFMVAVGPTMVVISLMFIIRPIGGHKQTHPSDGSNFTFVYSICLLMAAYLMGVLLVQDLVEVSHKVIVAFTVILFVLLLLPICIPISMCMLYEPPGSLTEVEPMVESEKGETEVIFSEIEDENLSEVDVLSASERQKRTAQLQARIAQAAAEGAVRVKRKKGPRRGEDFTLRQALIKADFWLIFISLVLAAGSGLTVIDNLGQMSQSLGYDNAHIFVSMISIWNFLGRVGGGYFSEIIVRDHAYPRPSAMAVAQAVMVGGHIFIGMGWPGALYIGTLFIGLGYGAHWAIVPATASELFGLKNFGALYNFLTLGNPAGSLIFSGVIASNIYDYEAEKQAHDRHQIPRGLILSKGMAALNEPLECEGAICFFFTSMIMASFCIIAVVLSTILVHRTKVVYAHLYGKAGI